MAHEISVVGGRAEMMYAGETPWHRLGTAVPQAVTASEAIEAAHLGWKVETRPIRVDGDGIIEGYAATVRTDTNTALGVVGDKWRPIQNVDAFAFMDGIGGGALKYECAGALRGGSRVWLLAHLPGDVEVARGDSIMRYLCLANGHDGSLAMRCFLTPVRVVCANTLRAAMDRSDRTRNTGDLRDVAERGITIRHTAKVESRMREAQRLLRTATEAYAEIAAVYRRLAASRLTDGGAKDYFAAVYPDDAQAESNVRRQVVRAHLAELWEGAAPGQEIARGTVWGAYNAVTYWLTHEHTRRGDAAKQAERDFEVNVMSGGGSIGRRALKEALALVG